MLTQERVKHLFTYDKKNGVLIRNFDRGMGKKGDICNGVDRHGYGVLGIDNKLYRTHRVIWLYVYGYLPVGPLDHINQCKTDNRIENLREVSFGQSRENIPVQKNNKCGLRGVWIHNQTNKWCASIGHKGKNIHLGSFTSAEEAYTAYKNAAAMYHTNNPLSTRETT